MALKEVEGLCRQLNNLEGLAKTFGNQANILYARGDLDGAIVLYKEEERICRQLDNLEGLQRDFWQSGVDFDSLRDLDGAMALLGRNRNRFVGSWVSSKASRRRSATRRIFYMLVVIWTVQWCYTRSRNGFVGSWAI